MKSRQIILICRFLTLILLSSIMMPAVFASISTDSDYAILCTSAGLVKVKLSDVDNDLSLNEKVSSSSQCFSCQLFDIASQKTLTLPKHLVPDASVTLLYRGILAPRVSQFIISHIPTRAPPAIS